jgi:Ca2+-binding EF-hand superfamily protein
VLANLKSFSTHNQVKRSALLMVGSQIFEKQQVENLAKIFKALDLNGDGFISHDELQKAFEEFFNGKQIEDEEVQEIIINVNLSRSGNLSFTEFLIGSMNEKQLLSQNKLENCFRLLDRDGISALSSDSFMDVIFQDENDEDLEKDMEVLQKEFYDLRKQKLCNKDGQVALDDFIVFMRM